MTHIITEAEFTAAMEAAVAERGEDFVYPDEWRDKTKRDIFGPDGPCLYSLPSGEPACLIGLALFKIDPKLMPDSGYVGSVSELVGNGVIRFESPLLADAAAEAQDSQDLKNPYGVVLQQYRDRVRKGSA